ncbi:MAG: hypothetical protein JO025_02825 [Verrucomicrobia bacterium]|nr:hypothetical protein [Verrucomicrobiota bacterium]
MKLRVAICAFTILLAPAVLAKTKFMVEDPNNVVVGRYGITSSQAAAAAEVAETFLTSGKLAEVQKAYVIRYIGVDAGPLTAEQASKEPASIARAARRLGRYGVEYDGNQPTRVIAIYDAIRHRVIHGRLYTVTEVPARYDYMRMDDELVMYVGSFGGEGKDSLRK